MRLLLHAEFILSAIAISGKANSMLVGSSNHSGQHTLSPTKNGIKSQWHPLFVPPKEMRKKIPSLFSPFPPPRF